MKKLLLILGICGFSSVFANTTSVNKSIESNPNCTSYYQKMHQNHKEIDQAYDKKDACTMGKLMIENRQIFESHPECFKPHNQKMLIASPQLPTKSK